ncbi:MAG: hypothetical protein ACRD2A_13750 [Vicinamibacterales bacterium]
MPRGVPLEQFVLARPGSIPFAITAPSPGIRAGRIRQIHVTRVSKKVAGFRLTHTSQNPEPSNR